jgi:outer membrane protein TolC
LNPPYEKVILNAHIEVLNGMSMIANLAKSYTQMELQEQTLTNSIDITKKLFLSARADYIEVLLTQRDALESKLQFVETKKEQNSARNILYKSLGGGWN